MNGFYPATSSCSSNTSPDLLKHQHLLLTTVPSSSHVSHPYFQQQKQYLFDPHHQRFHFNH
ncbi:unnamed protein product, partial [Rotaria socialis]